MTAETVSTEKNDVQPGEPLRTSDTVKEIQSSNLGYAFFVKRFALFLLVMVFGLLLDLGTKSWIFSWLGLPGEYLWEENREQQGIYWLIDGVLGFQTSLNQGALFGMGQGQIALFVVFSFIAITGILVWLFAFHGLRNLFLTFVLGIITAGILGNLYDRLGLHRLLWNEFGPSESVGKPVYAVRDWILVMIGDWPWPNFNIADSLIVCGAILLGIYAFIADEEALWGISKKDIP